MPQHCEGCPYKANRVVGSVGNPEADIVIIGEAPGGEEISRGRPFIGPSGRLLYTALDRAGISKPESDCFITNALMCRPPNKEAPSNDALKACRDRLMEEVRAHPRKLVLTLGNSALRSVYNSYNLKISRQRGQPDVGPAYTAFATWHPAAALRDHGGLRWTQMREDIVYAIGLLQDKPRRDPGVTEYNVCYSKEDVEQFIDETKSCTLFAADIETSGLDPRTNYITYLGISTGKNKATIFPRSVIKYLRPLFEDRMIRWAWHNGKFDTSFLQKLGIPARCDEDVMLLHYTLNEARGTHDLKQLSKDYLGATCRVPINPDEPDGPTREEEYDWPITNWLKQEKARRKREIRAAIKFSAQRIKYGKSVVELAETKAEKARKKAVKALESKIKKARTQRARKKAGFQGPLIEEIEQVPPIDHFLVYNLSYDFDETVQIPEFEPLEGYAQVPDDILIPYLANDCDYTWQLLHIFRPQVEAEPGLEFLYRKMLLPAGEFLQRVEDRGIFVDQKYLQKLKETLTERKEGTVQAVRHAVQPLWDPKAYMKQSGAKKLPDFFNVASTQQLSWLLYDRIGIRIPPGVKPTTNRAVLDLVKDQSPFIKLILDYRKTAKMLSTYVVAVEARLDRWGRVHSTYKLIGTETGRLSSADPNMQNIPGEVAIKSEFAAPDGYVLLEVDQSQAELRTLAALSGDEALTKIYQDGLDLHHEMCISIYGDEYLSCTNKERKGQLRRGAKTINFGIAYGMTAKLLAERLDITFDEAQRMIDIWFARFPKAKRFLDLCRSLPAKGRYIDTPFGRRRRFPLVTAESLHKIQNEAGNFPIQSVASDLTLMAGMRVDQELEAMGALVVNIVHDSLLIQVKNDAAVIRRVVELTRNTMIQTAVDFLGDVVPFDADAKIGPNWGNMHEYKLEAPEELRMAS